MKEVINPGLCLSCGACAASCTHAAVQMVDERPMLKTKCEVCNVCYYHCPQVNDQAALEVKTFGRSASEGEVLGIYERAFSAKALDPEIIAHAQDGGAVTALLAALLEVGFIDGAVVMGRDERWHPIPKVAVTKEELIECSGTKYSRGAILLGLRDAVDLYSCQRLALVGTPCQIKAFRAMATGERAVYRLTHAVRLCIGLFCMRAFPYEGFFKRVIEGQLEVKLEEVSKFDIKRGRFIIYRKGKPKRELALDALEQFVDAPCRLCSDFASELADISVGAVGSPPNRSTMLLRTSRAFEALDAVGRGKALELRPLEEVEPGPDAVKRAAMGKKKDVNNEIDRRRRLGKPLPPWLQRQEGGAT
ncbi:MAG: Coenzyme F420 hydrogenase/dehydrogenase, beta subunit C-terminal domain [Candidatus Hadarchaeales archaeon]